MAAEAAKSGKKITLISSMDGEHFAFPETAARLSQVVSDKIEYGGGGFILVPNVGAKALAKVVEYCSKHAPAAPAPAEAGCSSSAAATATAVAPAAASSSDLESFDAALMEDVDLETLCDLTLAANFLEIRGLLDIACKKVQGIIEGKSPKQIKEIFGIKSDYPESEDDDGGVEEI